MSLMISYKGHTTLVWILLNHSLRQVYALFSETIYIYTLLCEFSTTFILQDMIFLANKLGNLN